MAGSGENVASVGESLVLRLKDAAVIQQALESGLTIGFPTETVWGLGAAATPAGYGRLVAVKGRPPGKAFQLLCASTEEALKLADPAVHGALLRLAVFWPGALTLVVRASTSLPGQLVQAGKVGLRVPDHAASRGLAELAGGHLLSSSLNPSGQPAAGSFAQAFSYALADYLLTDDLPDSAGASGPVGQASTVFDLKTGEVLREGALAGEVRAAWRPR